MAAGGSRGAALGRAPRSAHVMAGGGRWRGLPAHAPATPRRPQSPRHRRRAPPPPGEELPPPPPSPRASPGRRGRGAPGRWEGPPEGWPGRARRSPAKGTGREGREREGNSARPGAAAVGAAGGYARRILPRTGEAALSAPPHPATGSGRRTPAANRGRGGGAGACAPLRGTPPAAILEKGAGRGGAGGGREGRCTPRGAPRPAPARLRMRERPFPPGRKRRSGWLYVPTRVRGAGGTPPEGRGYVWSRLLRGGASAAPSCQPPATG